MAAVPIEYQTSNGNLDLEEVFRDKLQDSALYLSELRFEGTELQVAQQNQRYTSGTLSSGSSERARYFAYSREANESMHQQFADFWDYMLTSSISTGDVIDKVVPQGQIFGYYSRVTLVRDGLELVSWAINGVKTKKELEEFHLKSMSVVLGALVLATLPIGGTVAASAFTASLLYDFAIKDYIRTINKLTP